MDLKWKRDMKWNRLLTLATAMLLNSSSGLLANDDDGLVVGNPSTGSGVKSDTAKAAVAVLPVSLIKRANAKMIERLYLIGINKQQDSIIMMKDAYIREQDNIIKGFQRKLADADELNAAIASDLKKERKAHKVIGYCAGGVILGLIISLVSR